MPPVKALEAFRDHRTLPSTPTLCTTSWHSLSCGAHVVTQSCPQPYKKEKYVTSSTARAFRLRASHNGSGGDGKDEKDASRPGYIRTQDASIARQGTHPVLTTIIHRGKRLMLGMPRSWLWQPFSSLAWHGDCVGLWHESACK